MLRAASARLAAIEAARSEPIAVVGIGCRFPGGATTAEQFWQLQLDAIDAITEVPPQRWELSAFHDPDPAAPGKMIARHGGFLGDLALFDAAFFGISAREATQMDPQQRLLLECAWEALEHGGQSPRQLAGAPVGVFIGSGIAEYAWSRHGVSLDRVGPYFSVGESISMVSGRVAYSLGLTGPALTLDTACSSSLVAVHLACEAIRRGECRAALAGGVNLMIIPRISVALSKAEMLSHDGRCKTFSAAANGYVRAEGCGVIHLKRLSDARRDGDRVLAVVRGSAVNQDGASAGLTAPSGPAQEAVIRRALQAGGVAPADVGYIEAHGTGTSLGDPIELHALGAVFGPHHSKDRPLVVGSVKTNIGHAEAAAGIAGLIKCVLAVHHGIIPAHLHFDEPNPFVPWNELPFQVPVQTMAWPRGECRIAGVSSFGFSGTNCHVVVEEPPADADAPPRHDRPLHLLALSGKTRAAVHEIAARYRDHVRGAQAELGDVCFSAATGRAHFAHRAALVFHDRDELIDQLAGLAGGEVPAGATVGSASAAAPRIAFLFSGQGSQYAGMARGLYRTEPVFRRAIDRCDAIVQSFGMVALPSILWGEHQAAIHETRYTQPALFAVEHALVELWRSWGIAPYVVIGHSVGDYAAAAAAGVFSVEQGLALIAARGHLMHEHTAPGAMAVVFASPDEVAAQLAPHADRAAIASINGPATVVVSGEPAAVAAITDACAARGARIRKLDVLRAFHSPLMAPVLDRFAGIVAGMRLQRPAIPLISNLHGRLAGDEVTTAAYWVRHIAEPVRFADGVAALGAEEPDAFLEIGPAPALVAMARPLLPRASDAPWLASLAPGKDDARQMLGALGALYARGAAVDWAGFDRDRGRRKVALPLTPFQRQRLWLDDPPAGPVRAGAPLHPLLGHRIQSALLKDGALQCEAALGRSIAFLTEHRVVDLAVMPAAGFIEIAIAAGQVALPDAEIAIHHVALQAPLVLPERGEARVQTVVAAPDDHGHRVEIYSWQPAAGDDGCWVLHASARLARAVAAAPAFEPLSDLQARIAREIGIEDYYGSFRDVGFDYRPAFRTIERLWRRDGEALALLRVPEAAGSAAGFQLHPVLLDGGLQATFAALLDRQPWTFQLPASIERVQLLGAPATCLWCHVQALAAQPESRSGNSFDARFYAVDGRPVADVRGVRMVAASPAALVAGRDVSDGLVYAVHWEPRERRAPSPPRTGDVVILADRGGVGARLGELLAAQGERVVTVLADRIDGASPDGWKALMSELGDRRCKAIVQLRALDATPAALDDARGAGDLGLALAASCGSTLHLIQAIADAGWPEPPRLWLVTRGAQPAPGTVRTNPAQAPLWGLGATLALEHAELACVRLDLDPAAPANDDRELRALAAELQAADDEAQIAYRGGVRHVARLARHTGHALAPIAGQPFRIRASAYGALENLSLQPVARRAPGPRQVEIEVAAASLNFKDVLHTLGLLREHSERAGIARAVDQPLGFECAGTVVAVGEGVAGIAAGDAVVASGQSCLASHVTTDVELVARKPAALSFAQAAALPTVFSTAIHALRRLARLQRGERVLIHAAAGGVGQAALQIALGLGAEVFATASPGKWAHLTAQGVRCAMSSRTLDFADQVMAATGGQGVHVVLNSLTGEFIPKSLGVLAPGGRYVEIGKLDVWDADRVARLRPDVAYHVFDLADAARYAPGLSASLLAETVAGFEAGSFEPLATRVFPVEEAVAAMRHLAQARNIGKVVLAMHAERDAPPIRADRTYWITGGFGALGLAVADWLVERGARSLVLSGRSIPAGPTEAAGAAIARLSRSGARISALAVDATARDQVAGALSHIAASLPPLAGVVHAAGVIDDGVMVRLTWPRFAEVMAPKVLGAWHLHQLTAGLALDFFACFSSIASVLGSPGQASYAAGNAFLDGLAHHRRDQGLPALTVNWGPWSGGGMASRIAGRHRARFSELGIASLSPAQGVGVLGRLLRRDQPQLIVLPIRWPRYLAQYRPGQRPRLFDALAADDEPARQGPTIRRQLDAAAPATRKAVLEAFLRHQLAHVLGLASPEAIERDQPLHSLGVDSLMATELRNRLEGQLAISLSATLVFNYPTLRALVDHLIGDVLQLPVDDPPAQPDGVHPQPPPPDEPDGIAALSDDEVERRLARSVDRILGDSDAGQEAR